MRKIGTDVVERGKKGEGRRGGTKGKGYRYGALGKEGRERMRRERGK